MAAERKGSGGNKLGFQEVEGRRVDKEEGGLGGGWGERYSRSRCVRDHVTDEEGELGVGCFRGGGRWSAGP